MNRILTLLFLLQGGGGKKKRTLDRPVRMLRRFHRRAKARAKPVVEALQQRLPLAFARDVSDATWPLRRPVRAAQGLESIGRQIDAQNYG